MDLQIRDERPGDVATIAALIAAAFREAPHRSGTEPRIVDALREAGQLTVSLVAEDGSRLLGHVAVSPVRLSDGTLGWHGLGPISVLPEVQGRGIGARLMQAALQRLRDIGSQGCVVLGEPGYYQRFGFRVEAGLWLAEVPSAYFMVLPLAGAVPAAEVQYHAAFFME